MFRYRHNVWGFVEWLANTLIFLIAGLVMGHRTLQNVQFVDWIILIALYFIIIGVRTVVMIILYPLVSTTGHKCTFKEAIFMTWSGLRGALAICLALIVEDSGGETVNSQDASRFLFYVGGIAALTIIINGTFAQAVLVQLGLIGNESKEKELVMNAIKKRLRHKMNGYIQELEAKHVMTAEDTADLRYSISLFGMPPELQKESDEDADDATVHSVPIAISHVAALDDGTVSALSSDTIGETEKMNSQNRPKAYDPPHVTDADIISSSVTPLSDIPQFLADDAAAVAALTQQTSDGAERKATGSFSEKIFKGPMSRPSSITQSSFRLMSISQRGPGSRIIPDLLAYVRTVFLELCRVKYWHMIEIGKIPRTSWSARFLLYTIEVGIDDVRGVVDGLKDYAVIEQNLEHIDLYIRVLTWLIHAFPKAWRLKRWSQMLAFLLARREKRSVYVLTSLKLINMLSSKLVAFSELTNLNVFIVLVPVLLLT